jgi:hypothetical protein
MKELAALKIKNMWINIKVYFLSNAHLKTHWTINNTSIESAFSVL